MMLRKRYDKGEIMTDKSDSAEKLLETIETLKRSEVRPLIQARTAQFKEMAKKPSSELFKELCFCILCANFTAERSIKIQNTVGDNFLNLPEKRLAQRLKALGHRFPNTRARYIVEARKHEGSLKTKIASFSDKQKLREWLIAEVKGLGPKEASHFLRNVGYTDFAIVDFHIVDVLVRHGLIQKPKTVTKRRYLEIEETLRHIAEKADLNMAELDLYLWFMETGKVLK
jgi:N-glycosylase/DNA lyase